MLNVSILHYTKVSWRYAFLVELKNDYCDFIAFNVHIFQDIPYHTVIVLQIESNQYLKCYMYSQKILTSERSSFSYSVLCILIFHIAHSELGMC
jgi:hypothetical protein